MSKLIGNGKYNYHALNELARQHDARCRQQADKLCREAGLGQFCACSLHNALLDQGTRKGWGAQITDYSKLRRASWLTTTEGFRGYRLLRQLYERIGYEGFNWK